MLYEGDSVTIDHEGQEDRLTVFMLGKYHERANHIMNEGDFQSIQRQALEMSSNEDDRDIEFPIFAKLDLAQNRSRLYLVRVAKNGAFLEEFAPTTLLIQWE